MAVLMEALQVAAAAMEVVMWEAAAMEVVLWAGGDGGGAAGGRVGA